MGVFPADIKRQVRTEQKGYCADCGDHITYKLLIHHIIPDRENGGDHRDNAVGLCIQCHSYWDEQSLIGNYFRKKI